MTPKPIGVFDSGIGGLTVLASLRKAFPQQSFVYLGDTARLPYGSKSPETIRQYSIQNLEFLANQGVSAIVVACNSASSQVSEQEFRGLPIYNVIEPGVQAALQASKTLRIGLLGTRATVASGAYQTRLRTAARASRQNLEVFSVSCPLFVPLAEEGWVDDPITNLIAFRYLQPLLQAQVDTIILGCTHYPILKSSISKAAGSGVSLVDSGEALAQILTQDFKSGRLLADQKGELRVLTTDWSEHLQNWGRELLSEPSIVFEKTNLSFLG